MLHDTNTSCLDYSSRVLKHMKGRKKILFLITDGLPQYSNNEYSLKRNTLMIMNQKALLKARRSTPNIFVLYIGSSDSHSYANWFIHQAFGKRVINVSDMRYAGKRIIKEFKNLVVNTLK